jgi:hypothetical protein
LDNNAEKMFVKNVSNNSKSNSSKSNESKKKKKKNNKLLDFLKNGFLDYSLDSNSILSNKESTDKNEEETKKTKKNKNFILKSELFSSFESDKKMKSEKVSPKPSLL